MIKFLLLHEIKAVKADRKLLYLNHIVAFVHMSARYYLVSWSLLVIRLQGIRWVCFVCVISLHCHYIIPISVTWFRALERGRAHFAFGSWDETLMQFESRGSTDEANRRSRKRLLLADCEAIFNCTSALTIQIWSLAFFVRRQTILIIDQFKRLWSHALQMRIRLSQRSNTIIKSSGS